MASNFARFQELLAKNGDLATVLGGLGGQVRALLLCPAEGQALGFAFLARLKLLCIVRGRARVGSRDVTSQLDRNFIGLAAV